MEGCSSSATVDEDLALDVEWFTGPPWWIVLPPVPPSAAGGGMGICNAGAPMAFARQTRPEGRQHACSSASTVSSDSAPPDCSRIQRPTGSLRIPPEITRSGQGGSRGSERAGSSDPSLT